jgi:hypothetical protein
MFYAGYIPITSPPATKLPDSGGLREFSVPNKGENSRLNRNQIFLPDRFPILLLDGLVSCVYDEFSQTLGIKIILRGVTPIRWLAC